MRPPDALTPRLPVLELVAERVDLFRQANRVVVEGDLVDYQGVPSGDHRRVALTQLGQAQQGTALTVDYADRVPQRLFPDFLSREVLQTGGQPPYLLPPQAAVGVILALGQLHDVHRLHFI